MLGLMGMCFLTVHTSHADVIYLKNGDRISGNITKMEDDTLTVEISYKDDSADLNIDWDKIERLEFDEPAQIKVFEKGVEEDDEYFIPTKEVEVKTLGGPEDIHLSRIEAIKIPPMRYNFSFDLGGNQASGNTNTSAFNLSLDGRAWSERHRIDIDAQLARATERGNETANNSRLKVGYGYYFTKRWYVGGNQLFETDVFQDLDIRSTTSLGIGRQIFDSGGHDLLAFLGGALVYEQFSSQEATSTPGATWIVRWSYELFGDDVELYHRQQGTRDMIGDMALRWNANQGIKLSAFSDFYFNFEFGFRFNSEPVAGTESTDESFILGVGYKFKN